MRIFGICGVKNSGKTTLICKLVEEFHRRGIRVATIKHDGHDFQADIPGTDTWKHIQAGAYGTAIFSSGKFMVIKHREKVNERELIGYFPEADLILLEGLKGSDYPKLELVRKGNSTKLSSDLNSLKGVVTDLGREQVIMDNPIIKYKGIPIWGFEDIEDIVEEILSIDD